MPDNTTSMLKVKFHPIDMEAIEKVVHGNDAISMAVTKMEDATLAIQTSVRLNHDLMQGHLDAVNDAVKASVCNFVKESIPHPDLNSAIDNQLVALDIKRNEYRELMEPLSKADEKQSLTAAWAADNKIPAERYTRMWVDIGSEEKQRFRKFEADTKRLKEFYRKSCEFADGRFDFFNAIVRQSLISPDVKHFQYYGYGDHAKRFAGPQTQEAMDRHMYDFDMRRSQAEEEMGDAKFYAGIANAWFNDQDFPLWREKLPEELAIKIDSLKVKHVENCVTLDILTNDPFPSLDIDAELSYIRTAYEIVANKKSMAALPLTWVSKFVGKGPMQEAVADMLESKLQLARKNQIKRQGLIHDMLKKTSRLWIDSSLGPTHLSKNELDDQLTDHVLNQKLERYDAAMCDLRPDGRVPDSADENELPLIVKSVSSQQATKIKKFLDELRASDKMFYDSMSDIKVLSEKIRLMHKQIDRPDNGEFKDVNSYLDDLLLAKKVHDADASNRGDTLSLVRRLANEMDEKVTSNVRKRDEMIAEEIENCKNSFQEFFAAPDIEDDPPERAAAHSATKKQSSVNLARRKQIFVDDWSASMRRWEGLSSWPSVAIVKDEAEQFSSKKNFVSAKSMTIDRQIRSLSRTDQFIIEYPNQTKEEFFRKTLEKTVESVQSALKRLKEIDFESETIRKTESDDRGLRELEDFQDWKRFNIKSGFPAFAIDYDILQIMAATFDESQSEEIKRGLSYLRENVSTPQPQSDRIRIWVQAVTRANLGIAPM